jgi:hypothetical protein
MTNETGIDRNERKNRPLEPEHPMSLEGGVVDGDLCLMARCQLEETLLFGTSPEEILAMADHPNFQGLYAAKLTLGAETFQKIFEETLERIGFHRATCVETPVVEYPETFIPIAILHSPPEKEPDHA